MPRMAPAVSALARQTITAAFEDLERTLSPVDAREMHSITALQQVRTAALDIERQLAARQALRNMRRLMPLLNGLEHYSKVVDVLCNGTPFLAWIWSPMSLILRVASEYVEAFEQLMKGYARIAATLSRFELLSNTFYDPDFQHSLAVFYANILQFHKQAYQFVRRSGWRLLFLTSWGRFQRRFDNILEDLERHGDLIDRAANARNISEARQLRQDIRTWKEDSLEQVRQAEEHQATKQYQSILSWLRIDESEQLSIFESTFEEVSKFPGTCAWMLKNERICPWLQKKPSGNLLWLQGNPGSGKSVLSTQLVNFLRTSKSFVMNHFCSQTFASSTRYEAVLKSLLHQLLRKSGELVAYAYQDFVVGKKLPTTSNIEQLIQTLLGALSEAGQTEYVWIVVDGIEDCEIAKQARLIALLSQIAKSGMHSETVCKVLITSRTHPIKFKRIWQKHTVSLSDETEQLTKAIKLYASQRLRLLHERLQQLELDSEDVDTIEEAIAHKAAGMFLYARLVLDYLGTNIFFSGDELKRSIGQLPETISEFYRNILAQMLSRFDARSADRLRCTLSWIAYAKRPLKRQELLSALAFSSGDPSVTTPAPKYMLELCSPLVEERRDTSLSFIHVSVKEFLQSSSSAVAINEHDALREHGLATITCLLAAVEVFNKDVPEQTRLLRLVKGVHALHIYSTEYWTEYLLANAASLQGLQASPALISLGSRLVEALDTISSACPRQLESLPGVADDRLRFLDPHPKLKRQVDKALLARSIKRMEWEILDQTVVTDIRPLDGVSTILNSYQKAVEIILDQDSCAGASTEELELFKTHFRTSAYTCRLRSCPRATLGFDTEKLRHEHEIGHAGGFRCSFSGCHYPPFRAAQNLASHTQRYHALDSARKSIRRVGRFPSGKPQKSPEVEIKAVIDKRVSLGQFNGNDMLDMTITPNAGADELLITMISSRRLFAAKSWNQAQQMLEQNPGMISTTNDNMFPREEFNTHIQHDLPLDIVTWAQLKHWANENPSLLPSISNKNLQLLQILHSTTEVKHQQDSSSQMDNMSPQGLQQATPQTGGATMLPTPPTASRTTDDLWIEAETAEKRQDGLHSGEKKFVCSGWRNDGKSWGCGEQFAHASALKCHFDSKAGQVCMRPFFEERTQEDGTYGAPIQAQGDAGMDLGEYGDPKAIADMLSLQVPSNEDFPTIHDLHRCLSPHGTRLSSFITAILPKIDKEDVRLLTHMTMLVAEVRWPPPGTSGGDFLNNVVLSPENIRKETIVHLIEGWREQSRVLGVGIKNTTVFPLFEQTLLREINEQISRVMELGKPSIDLLDPAMTRSMQQIGTRALSIPGSQQRPSTGAPAFDIPSKTSIGYSDQMTYMSTNTPHSTSSGSFDQDSGLPKSQVQPDGEAQPKTSSPNAPLVGCSVADEDSAMSLTRENLASEHGHHSSSGDQYETATQSMYPPTPQRMEASLNPFLGLPPPISKFDLFSNPKVLASVLGISEPASTFPSLSEVYFAIPYPGGIQYSELASLLLDRFARNEQHLLKCMAAVAYQLHEVVHRKLPVPSQQDITTSLAEYQTEPKSTLIPQHGAETIMLDSQPQDSKMSKALRLLDDPIFLADALGFLAPLPPDFPSLREIHQAISVTGAPFSHLLSRFQSRMVGDSNVAASLSAVGHVVKYRDPHYSTIFQNPDDQLTDAFIGDWAQRQKVRMREVELSQQRSAFLGRNVKRSSTALSESTLSKPGTKRLRL